MSILIVLLCVYIGVSGQVVQDQIREPSCSDGTSVYSCSRNNGLVLFWSFELTGRSFTSIRPTSEVVTTVKVGSAVVTLTRTSVTDTSINVTATISYSDTVILNGTYMDCNGERLYINANLPSNCSFRNNENLNFILFSDGNWAIECSNSSDAFNVTCFADGSWSQQITCFSKVLTPINVTTQASESSTTGLDCSETSSSDRGGNILLVYLLGTSVIINLVLIGIITVIIVYFTTKKKRIVENLRLSKTLSAKKGSNDGPEGCAIDLVDNAAYGYIATK